jgi:dihydrofolate reductase
MVKNDVVELLSVEVQMKLKKNMYRSQTITHIVSLIMGKKTFEILIK